METILIVDDDTDLGWNLSNILKVKVTTQSLWETE